MLVGVKLLAGVNTTVNKFVPVIKLHAVVNVPALNDFDGVPNSVIADVYTPPLFTALYFTTSVYVCMSVPSVRLIVKLIVPPVPFNVVNDIVNKLLAPLFTKLNSEGHISCMYS